MKFSGKMWFMIILKVTKNQYPVFHSLFTRYFFQKTQGGQINPPPPSAFSCSSTNVFWRNTDNLLLFSIHRFIIITVCELLTLCECNEMQSPGVSFFRFKKWKLSDSDILMSEDGYSNSKSKITDSIFLLVMRTVILTILAYQNELNPLQPTVAFLYLLKTSENL